MRRLILLGDARDQLIEIGQPLPPQRAERRTQEIRPVAVMQIQRHVEGRAAEQVMLCGDHGSTVLQQRFDPFHRTRRDRDRMSDGRGFRLRLLQVERHHDDDAGGRLQRQRPPRPIRQALPDVADAGEVLHLHWLAASSRQCRGGACRDGVLIGHQVALRDRRPQHRNTHRAGRCRAAGLRRAEAAGIVAIGDPGSFGGLHMRHAVRLEPRSQHGIRDHARIFLVLGEGNAAGGLRDAEHADRGQQAEQRQDHVVAPRQTPGRGRGSLSKGCGSTVYPATSSRPSRRTSIGASRDAASAPSSHRLIPYGSCVI